MRSSLILFLPQSLGGVLKYIKSILFFAIAQAAFGGLVTSLAALNPDNTGDWASLVGVSPLGGVAPDNVIDLPIGYGQIPVTVTGAEFLDPVVSFGFPDGTQGLLNEAAGPISMAFPSVYGVGFYITDRLGNGYTAQIETFDVNGNSLGTFSESAFDNFLFLGVLDSSPDIASIQITTSGGIFDTNEFAIGNVHVNQKAGAVSSAAAPEPSTLALCMSALLILVSRNKDRARESQRRPCAATTRRN